MANKPKRKAHSEIAALTAPRRRAWVIGVVLTASVVAGVLLLKTRQGPAPARAAPAAPAAPAAVAEAKAATTTPPLSPLAQRVVGRWLRPDGGYVLELRALKSGGALEAAYFNPRPIHVGRAAWWEKDGRPAVYVELQDTGYPGATYELGYDADRDQLVGTYTQPAVQQTFEVEFTRLSAPTEP